MTEPALSARINLARDGFRLRVDLTARRGEVLALLGPNGSGKSTVLGCLAGLLRPADARITLGGRLLTGDRKLVPPHARGVGLLAQQPLLFPHLSVLHNVAFGPRCQGRSRSEANRLAAGWLSEVDAEQFADRRPSQLSGGQAQRVALARTLASEPELLLLDEPFAALDVDAAPALRTLVGTVLRDAARTTVLVTHDPLDALVLADRVVVMQDGAVVEDGPTREVLAKPRTGFTARIAGLNLVRGTARAEGVRTSDGTVLAGIASTELAGGAPAAAVFPPAAVAVRLMNTGDTDIADTMDATASPRNTLPAVVDSLEPYGPVIRLRAKAGADGPACVEGIIADLTPQAVAELELRPGRPVQLVIKATQVAVHPR
ncbi:molybdate transport system ATP-binding protein [Tamaricihabitans halophyticus]|uniref:Molybdate transport system ATP-binding protein n=1 Tax=Tamaricihabitans halophyticus TaxID=1262583 RepID=A0A4R2RAW5_9PSEU|nr:ATP-binding cassette domain-containing protein [Tamaricihabitans halophyticus]TCP56565.1 molybdate transport system ATP-binding protein [Tamaricihabitans halophyticus]